MYDFINDRKSEPRALSRFFSREKRVKYLVFNFVVNPAPAVPYFNRYPRRIVGPGSDTERPFAVHRIGRIGNNI